MNGVGFEILARTPIPQLPPAQSDIIELCPLIDKDAYN